MRYLFVFGKVKKMSRWLADFESHNISNSCTQNVQNAGE